MVMEGAIEVSMKPLLVFVQHRRSSGSCIKPFLKLLFLVSLGNGTRGTIPDPTSSIM